MRRDKIQTLINLDNVEDDAIKQLAAITDNTDVARVAVMPDIHTGYDMPIGCVALTFERIYPAWVGYDIGCGMCYVDTGLPISDVVYHEHARRDWLKSVYDRIAKAVPIINKADPLFDINVVPFKSASGDKELTQKVNANEKHQIGTLGSGNHFVEIGLTTKDTLAVVIHSGSRKAGWNIAKFYMDRAKKLDPAHGGLDINYGLGAAYMQDMTWAVQFAFNNRHRIMWATLRAMGFGPMAADNMMSDMANEAHNYAEITPGGIIHRKGATSAKSGEVGVIPGNRAVGTYITEGLGNVQFLSSASHGAGRKMSRGKARKTIAMADYMAQCADIVGNINEETLDEAPDAYKDLNEVIQAQDGVVVNVVDHVRPLLSFKGESFINKKKE